MAELGEAVRLFTEGVAQDARKGEDPVAMWDGEADFVPDEGGCIEGAPLMAAGAAASPLAGEGEKIVMAAVGALDAKKAVGKVAAAKAGVKGGLAGSIKWPEVF